MQAMGAVTHRRRWRWLRRSLATVGLALAALTWGGCQMFDMPGKSFTGQRPPASAAQQRLAEQLRSDVAALSEDIGPRHTGRPEALHEAERFIERAFTDMGYAVDRQHYEVDGVKCANLIVEIEGSASPEEIVVLGAHYDSVPHCPGANDNATGIAGLLALARTAAERDQPPKRTLRLVAFVNEEPPYFQTDKMGSYVYAQRCAERGDDIVAMLSFDGIGYFTDQPDTQEYPLAFLGALYPSEGDFIGLVSNWSSRTLLYRCVGTFRDHVQFPSQGAAVPNITPAAGFSDHWSFWQFDYPGVMVTDTLPFRYPQYHTDADEIDKLDFDGMARVVTGLEAVMFDLIDGPPID
jgi:hypothetical protein